MESKLIHWPNLIVSTENTQSRFSRLMNILLSENRHGRWLVEEGPQISSTLCNDPMVTSSSSSSYPALLNTIVQGRAELGVWWIVSMVSRRRQCQLGLAMLTWSQTWVYNKVNSSCKGKVFSCCCEFIFLERQGFSGMWHLCWTVSAPSIWRYMPYAWKLFCDVGYGPMTKVAQTLSILLKINEMGQPIQHTSMVTHNISLPLKPPGRRGTGNRMSSWHFVVRSSVRIYVCRDVSNICEDCPNYLQHLVTVPKYISFNCLNVLDKHISPMSPLDTWHSGELLVVSIPALVPPLSHGQWTLDRNNIDISYCCIIHTIILATLLVSLSYSISKVTYPHSSFIQSQASI